MEHVKRFYIAMLAFLTCASSPILAGGYDNDTKDDFERDLILDKVEEVIWECAKHGFPDMAISITSAIVNYPYIQPDDYIKFVELRSKMYLLNGDPEDAHADKNLAKRRRLSQKD